MAVPARGTATGHGRLDIRESPLVGYATEARRPSRWWVGWLVVLGGGVLVVNIGLGPLVSALLGSPEAGSPMSQVGEVVTNGITLVLVALWLVVKERRPFSSVGFRGSHAAGRAIAGFALGIVAFLVGSRATWWASPSAVRLAR